MKQWIRNHPDLWQFILFNLLSNCATVTNFVVMWLCTRFLFAPAQTVNFFVQKNWVFRSNARFRQAVPKYILLALVLVILSAAMPAYSQSFFVGAGISPAIAPTLATVVNVLLQIVISYPAMKFWIMPQT